MRELMRDFEACKKAFAQHSPDMPIDLPKPLTNLTIQRVVNQGELIITKYLPPHASCLYAF